MGAPFPCSWWMRLAGKQSLSFPSVHLRASLPSPLELLPWGGARLLPGWSA